MTNPFFVCCIGYIFIIFCTELMPIMLDNSWNTTIFLRYAISFVLASIMIYVLLILYQFNRIKL